MASQIPPLDEQSWSSPGHVMEYGGIHDNSVLFYFARSPFFDPTSNNATLETQAMHNQSMLQHIQTRTAFEARLKTMAGLEFIIAQEPAETNPGAGTGVWVIRKQTRRKRPGEEDEITVHSSYFVVGENIYMATALSNILASRMLSVISSLNKFIASASALPDFSPALGHTYMPPSISKTHKSAGSQLGQASKENTPMPDSLQASKKDATSTNNSTFLDSRLLEQSLYTHLNYGDEYMDENPITGQPGEFHLSSTGRKEKDKLMVPAARGPLQTPAKATPAPTPLKTNIPPERKGSKSEKSPKTPGMPKPKRRKSKAQGAGGISPT